MPLFFCEGKSTLIMKNDVFCPTNRHRLISQYNKKNPFSSLYEKKLKPFQIHFGTPLSLFDTLFTLNFFLFDPILILKNLKNLTMFSHMGWWIETEQHYRMRHK